VLVRDQAVGPGKPGNGDDAVERRDEVGDDAWPVEAESARVARRQSIRQLERRTLRGLEQKL